MDRLTIYGLIYEIEAMTSKKYKPLVRGKLSRAKKEQLKFIQPTDWRRSSYNYELPDGVDARSELREIFEIIAHIVVEADDRLLGKNLHGAAAVRAAFIEAGLDPRHPNHWYQIMQIFAESHFQREPHDKARKKAKLGEIREHAESIRAKLAGISKNEVLDKMKDTPGKNYPSKDRLGKLLREAGVVWYTPKKGIGRI